MVLLVFGVVSGWVWLVGMFVFDDGLLDCDEDTDCIFGVQEM